LSCHVSPPLCEQLIFSSDKAGGGGCCCVCEDDDDDVEEDVPLLLMDKAVVTALFLVTKAVVGSNILDGWTLRLMSLGCPCCFALVVRGEGEAARVVVKQLKFLAAADEGSNTIMFDLVVKNVVQKADTRFPLSNISSASSEKGSRRPKSTGQT
jgi:hypothetical protein